MLPRLIGLACTLGLTTAVPYQPAAEAMKLAAAGDFIGAERLLIKAAAAAPSDPELRYRLGAIQLRLKKPQDALPHLETAARLSPSIPPVWLALAHARLESGKAPEAQAAAVEARKLAGANANFSRALGSFHHQLALAFRKAKDPAKAVEAWQEAIALDPGQAAWYGELAELFLDHRTPEPAVAVLESAARRFPQHVELLRLLGLAHYSAGDAAKAIEVFLRVMDLAPDAEQSYSSVETLLPDAGAALPAIVEKLRRFTTSQPASPVGHFLLAQAVAIQTPGAPEAEAMLREAIRVEPKFWPAHYELHKPLLARGQTPEAAQSLERAVALNPAYAPARYALAQAYAKLGDRAKASEQRRAHHELLSRERESAQARQAAMPRLPYQLRKP